MHADEVCRPDMATGEESERRFLLASLKKQGWGIKQLEQQQLYLLSYHPAH